MRGGGQGEKRVLSPYGIKYGRKLHVLMFTGKPSNKRTKDRIPAKHVDGLQRQRRVSANHSGLHRCNAEAVTTYPCTLELPVALASRLANVLEINSKSSN